MAELFIEQITTNLLSGLGELVAQLILYILIQSQEVQNARQSV